MRDQTGECKRNCRPCKVERVEPGLREIIPHVIERHDNHDETAEEVDRIQASPGRRRGARFRQRCRPRMDG